MDEKEIKPSVLHANGCNYRLVPIPWGISHSFNKAWSAQDLPRCTYGQSTCALHKHIFFTAHTFAPDHIADLYKRPDYWTVVMVSGEAQKWKSQYKDNILKKMNISKNCWTESIKNPQTCFPHFLIHVTSSNWYWYTDLQNMCELLTLPVNN